MQIELEALRKESGAKASARRAQLQSSLFAKQAEAERANASWSEERETLEQACMHIGIGMHRGACMQPTQERETLEAAASISSPLPLFRSARRRGSGCSRRGRTSLSPSGR